MAFMTSIYCDRGGREYNQDRAHFQITEAFGCWVLADGLGGMGGGEIASELAVGAIFAFFGAHAECSAAALHTYLEAANRAVEEGQRENPQAGSMRTTAVILLADQDQAIWGHVGDSRLYFFSSGRIAHQTLDHSVPQSLVDAGQLTPDEIRFHEDRNRLLKSIGGRGDLGASVEDKPRQISKGDAFLLASDGFWEHVTEAEMEVELAKALTPETWIAGMLTRLRARAEPDHDNCSAIAILVN